LYGAGVVGQPAPGSEKTQKLQEMRHQGDATTAMKVEPIGMAGLGIT